MLEGLANFLENCLDFSNIFNVSINASWLILALLAVRLLLKNAPKWIHVTMWGLVAVRLLLPVSLESAFSLIPSAETIPQEILRYEGEQLKEPAHLNIVTNPVMPKKVIVELEQSVDRVNVRTIHITYIWWSGMAIMILYTTVSYFRLQRKVRTAVRRCENIFRSEHVDVPFVLGILKPRIYMPYKISEQDMPYVIAHEQTHIRRKDHWWKPFGFLLLTIHWFNPLMWVAYVLLCRDIELACDEKVIKKLGKNERADYSQALLSCSVDRRSIAACPLAFGEVGVKERVKNVISYKKPAFWIVLLALIAGAAVAVCFLTDPVTDEAENTVTETTDTEMPSIVIPTLDTDSLYSLGGSNHEMNSAEYYNVTFDANLGDKVKYGKLYMEQWHNGACMQSIPLTIMPELGETYIIMDITQDMEKSKVRVEILSEGHNGLWAHNYYFPGNEVITGWTYDSYEQGESLKVKPGEEKILAALAFDDGGGTGNLDCDTLAANPAKLKDGGYMLVVRAVFDNEPLDVELKDSKSSLKMKMLYMDDMVTVEDEERKEAYIAALEQILYKRESPDGEDWSVGYSSKSVAFYDIDFDGNEELLLDYDDGHLGSPKLYIYDYDEKNGTVRREFYSYSPIFYENGVVKVNQTHMPGPIGEATDFWPYSLYKYDEAMDTYEFIAHTYGWEKAFANEYDGRKFPAEADADDDGMVYFIHTGDEYYIDTQAVDNDVYNAWVESMTGDAEEIDLSVMEFMQLPTVAPMPAG